MTNPLDIKKIYNIQKNIETTITSSESNYNKLDKTIGSNVIRLNGDIFAQTKPNSSSFQLKNIIITRKNSVDQL